MMEELKWGFTEIGDGGEPRGSSSLHVGPRSTRYSWQELYPSAQGCQSIPTATAQAKDTDTGELVGREE